MSKGKPRRQRNPERKKEATSDPSSASTLSLW